MISFYEWAGYNAGLLKTKWRLSVPGEMQVIHTIDPATLTSTSVSVPVVRMANNDEIETFIDAVVNHISPHVTAYMGADTGKYEGGYVSAVRQLQALSMQELGEKFALATKPIFLRSIVVDGNGYLVAKFG